MQSSANEVGAPRQVLVIDDDRGVLHMLSEALRKDGAEVLTAASLAGGLELARSRPVDAILLDLVLPDGSGLDLLRQIQAWDRRTPVVLMTAAGDSDTAIEAMKLGAFDYLAKPLAAEQVCRVARLAAECHRRMTVRVQFPLLAADDAQQETLVGVSTPMLAVYKAIGWAAPQNIPVLIQGESGTGKELVARALYQHSGRASGPFLAVNCAALPMTLLESELFGHEKGAFTGADRRRIGKFEQCSGGTIFLDEVGDMALPAQAKLLRVLQEGAFERVGGAETVQIDVRVIAATNRRLPEMVAEGGFRNDLFYRLNGYAIDLPPLRDRGDDLRLLAEHFFARYAQAMRRTVSEIAPETFERLARYDWPGNVRELQAAIRKTLLHTIGPVVLPEYVPPLGDGTDADAARRRASARSAPKSAGGPLTEALKADLASGERPATGASSSGERPASGPWAGLEKRLEEGLARGEENLHEQGLAVFETYLLERVLRHTRGNQTQAAKLLGWSRGNLRRKLRDLRLSIEQVVTVEDEDEEA